MSIVSNSTDPGNSFPAACSNNEHKPFQITGFDLTSIIELSPLPKSVTRVLKFACNLAASTPKFVIVKSLKNLAEDAGCSVSTVQRAYKAAVKMGILIHEDQHHPRNIKESAPSKYTFSRKALSFVRMSLAALKAANQKPTGRQSLVRKIVANAFYKNNFTCGTPSQSDTSHPGQTDQQEIRDTSRKRETLNREPSKSDAEKSAEQPAAPEKKSGSYLKTRNELAEAAAAARNVRRAKEFARKGEILHETYQKLKASFKTKPNASRKPKGRQSVDPFNGDYSNVDYSPPEGWRSC